MSLPNYLTDINETRLFLKKNFDGPEVVKALRFRLETHLKDPTLDPLSNQVWEGYLKLPHLLKEPFSLLDAGCMSGFLYHHLKRNFSDFTYTGIDRWPEALHVAKEFAPEVTFLQGDFMKDDLGGMYDYIVCSNIPFKSEEEVVSAITHMTGNVKRNLIMIYPDSEIHVITPTASALSVTNA